MKNFKLYLTIFLFLLLCLIACSPQKYIEAGLNGLSAWAFNVLPCVLPFMIISRLIIELGEVEKLTKPFSKPFKFLYGTNSSACYVFLMSILAGYPVGSKMTAELYESGKINLTEAYRMSSFCSNSGPMFIIGTVGCLLLKSPAAGAILFASHVLSALINGLFYRKTTAKNQPESGTFATKPQPATFSDVVLVAVQGILNVGAIICLFFIIIEALSPLFSLFPSPLVPLFEGMVELTRGCIDASTLPLYPAIIICSFLISFGGISTILQSKAMLKKLRMPTWLFSVQKLTQGIISAVITALLALAI